MAEESPRTPPPVPTLYYPTESPPPPPRPKRRRIGTLSLSLDLMDRLGDLSLEKEAAFSRCLEFTVTSVQRNLRAMRETQVELEAKEDLNHKEHCRILRSYRILYCLPDPPSVMKDQRSLVIPYEENKH